MPSLYYKFKPFKGGFRCLPIGGPFISVYDLKARIFASDCYGHGKDFDLLISNVDTEEHTAGESELIPAYSSVVIRRVPGLRRSPIVIDEVQVPVIGNNNPSSYSSSALKDPELEENESSDFDDFGPDPFSIPVTSTVVIQSNAHCSEEEKMNGGGFKALPETVPVTSTVVIQSNIYCSVEEKMNGGGFKALPEKSFRIPPQGYVCHRCKVAGHYIQHCPTNGDPNFDFRKDSKSVTAVGNSNSKTSVSSSNSSGISYASASTSGSHSSIAPELYCPLCKNVMKDAALTKCCFGTFCEKCIKHLVVTNSGCFCGMKIDANDIIPNKTIRETIDRILNECQSGNTVECKRKHTLEENEAAEVTRKRQKKEEEACLELRQWQKMSLLKRDVKSKSKTKYVE